MPLEYFGVETNHFVQQPQFQSSNANISFIRPPMNMLDISMNGGNKKVNFSSKIFLSAIDEISNKLNTPVEKKLEMSKKLKEKFENLFTEIFNKTIKKLQDKTHLKHQELSATLDIKKYHYIR